MPEVDIRVVTANDIPVCAHVFLEARADLAQRNNLVLRPGITDIVEKHYEHVRRTGIFQAATIDGRIVALACAIVREKNWFLCGFWALPEVQRQHIGMSLLRRVWQAGVDSGAEVFFTWSSIDLTAMSAYFKLGLLPGSQILVFGGEPSHLKTPGAGYSLRSLEIEQVSDLDRSLRGARRNQDLEFMSDTGMQGYMVISHGEVGGYFYVKDGAIGPAGWRAPHHASSVLNMAMEMACETSKEIALYVPGRNHAGLRAALAAGLRLTGYSHFLASAKFGKIEQYLPSGPGLF